jgi:hypothetical protein
MLAADLVASVAIRTARESQLMITYLHIQETFVFLFLRGKYSSNFVV